MARSERAGAQVNAPPLELRDAGNGELMFTGYASVTEVPYEVGHYIETIRRGAFKRTLNEKPPPDCVLLVNHEGLPLARTHAGTMTLSEDHTGLRVDARLDGSDPDVQSVARKIRRRDLTEMSFAFRATEQDWSPDYSERVIRAVSISRGDCSIVTQGANPHTSVSVRSQELTFEQRKAKAEALAWRMHGTTRGGPRNGEDDDDVAIADCETCDGKGWISCPDCRGVEPDGSQVETIGESMRSLDWARERARRMAAPGIAATRTVDEMRQAELRRQRRRRMTG
jgi:HK97 family phage prohead protease